MRIQHPGFVKTLIMDNKLLNVYRYIVFRNGNQMKTIVYFIIVLIFANLSYSCEAQDITNLMTKQDSRDMLRLVNKARQKGVRCGKKYYKPVEPLKWDDQLEKAAVDKSYDMYREKYFAHTSPDGETLTDRLAQYEYEWLSMGENLAMGPTSVKQVVEGWLNSEGHCKNIMKSSYTHLGAAQYGTYWTQVFAKPRDN